MHQREILSSHVAWILPDGMVVGHDGMFADGLKVNCAVRFATLLDTDDHLVSPCDRFANRDWFYDS